MEDRSTLVIDGFQAVVVKSWGNMGDVRNLLFVVKRLARMAPGVETVIRGIWGEVDGLVAQALGHSI
jgi:hypothetical protein